MRKLEAIPLPASSLNPTPDFPSMEFPEPSNQIAVISQETGAKIEKRVLAPSAWDYTDPVTGNTGAVA